MLRAAVPGLFTLQHSRASGYFPGFCPSRVPFISSGANTGSASRQSCPLPPAWHPAATGIPVGMAVSPRPGHGPVWGPGGACTPYRVGLTGPRRVLGGLWGAAGTRRSLAGLGFGFCCTSRRDLRVFGWLKALQRPILGSSCLGFCSSRRWLFPGMWAELSPCLSRGAGFQELALGRVWRGCWALGM